MKHLERQTRFLCNEVIDLERLTGAKLVTGVRRAAAEAAETLRLMAPARRPSPSSKLKGPTRKQEKAAADAQHALDWAAIKTAVLERARVESGGRCELGCGREINDPHHLISGSGKKRPNERFDTVIAICRCCHDNYEDGVLVTLGWASEWARRHGYYRAAGEVDRRIVRTKRIRAATAAKGDVNHG